MAEANYQAVSAPLNMYNMSGMQAPPSTGISGPMLVDRSENSMLRDQVCRVRLCNENLQEDYNNLKKRCTELEAERDRLRASSSLEQGLTQSTTAANAQYQQPSTVQGNVGLFSLDLSDLPDLSDCMGDSFEEFAKSLTK